MNNPYFNSNKRGIPTISTTAVTTTDTTTALVLPNNTFWGKWYQGILFIEVDQALPEGGEANTLILQVNGETRPLQLANGEQATVANIATNGAVFQVYYDKPRNYVQLMTIAPATAVGGAVKTPISASGK